MSRREYPFSPKGNCTLLVGATTAPASIQVQPDDKPTAKPVYDCFTLTNTGAVDAFVGYSARQDASTTTVIPTAGTSQKVVALPSGVTAILRFQPNAYFSAITASGSANIYITPGEGL